MFPIKSHVMFFNYKNECLLIKLISKYKGHPLVKWLIKEQRKNGWYLVRVEGYISIVFENLYILTNNWLIIQKIFTKY